MKYLVSVFATIGITASLLGMAILVMNIYKFIKDFYMLSIMHNSLRDEVRLCRSQVKELLEWKKEIESGVKEMLEKENR